LALASAGYIFTRREAPQIPTVQRTKVFLTKTEDRALGVRTLLSNFDLKTFAGKSVALKANFNSADEFPASTHLDTLSSLVTALKDAGTREITLAERSGMGSTRDVLESRGVFELSRKLGFKVVVIDDLTDGELVHVNPEGSHWKRGFLIAKTFRDADRVVQTCCLKTHAYGGHFTMSLKNSVGLVTRFPPFPDYSYNYMQELHSSPDHRLLIAEINQAYRTDLIIMDGIQAFVSGGPASGKIVSPSAMIAGNDRVAVDAVGVAILRMFGTTPQVSAGKVFEQEQIARAAELGVGVRSPEEIDLQAVEGESSEFVQRIRSLLDQK